MWGETGRRQVFHGRCQHGCWLPRLPAAERPRANKPLQASAAAAAGGAAAEIEHFRVDLPAGCGSGGAATEAAEKLLHLLALLKLNLVQRKVRGWCWGTRLWAGQGYEPQAPPGRRQKALAGNGCAAQLAGGGTHASLTLPTPPPPMHRCWCL